MLNIAEDRKFYLEIKQHYLEFCEIALEQYKKTKNKIYLEHCKQLAEVYLLIRNLYAHEGIASII